MYINPWFFLRFWLIFHHFWPKLYIFHHFSPFLVFRLNCCLGRTNGLRMSPGRPWWLGTLLGWLASMITEGNQSTHSRDALLVGSSYNRNLKNQFSNRNQDFLWILRVRLPDRAAEPSVSHACPSWWQVLETSRSHQRTRGPLRPSDCAW